MKTIHLILTICFLSIVGYSQQIISSNTTWSGTIFLSQKVIINEGVTLTIEPSTNIVIGYIDSNGDNIGDVEIEVNGKINILGNKVCNPVNFGPLVKTTNRKYWKGIKINSAITNDSIIGVNISNADIPFNVLSSAIIRDCNISLFESNGINYTPINNNLILQLQSTIIKNGRTGIYQSNTTSILKADWIYIDSCINAIIGNEGELELKSSKILNSKRLGVSFNDGTLKVFNSIIKNNYAFGVFSSSGNLSIKNSEIDSNYLGGVLLSGLGKNIIEYSNIINNKGAQIEISDYKFNLNHYGSMTSPYDGIPTINVNNNNILGDTLSTVIDTARLFFLDYGTPSCGLDGNGWSNGGNWFVCVNNLNPWVNFPTVLGRLNKVFISLKYQATGYPNTGQMIFKDKSSVLYSTPTLSNYEFTGWINTTPSYDRIKSFQIITNGNSNSCGGCASSSARMRVGIKAYELRAEYLFGGDLIYNNIRTVVTPQFNFTSNNFGQSLLMNYFFDQSKQSLNYSNYTIFNIQDAGISYGKQFLNTNQSNLVYLNTLNESDTICNSSNFLVIKKILNASYNWYLNGNLFTTNTLNTYLPPVSGEWFCIVISNGCQYTSTVKNIIISSGPTLSVSGSKEICQGKSTTLVASGAQSYAWDNGKTTPEITISPTNTTTLTVTGILNGCKSSLNVPITINKLPTISIDPYPSAVICSGSSLKLTASGAKDYVWNNGSTGSNITVNSAGVYSVTGTDVNGCTNTSQNTTLISSTTPLSAVITPAGPTTFCQGGSVVLNANTGSGLSYQWFKNSSPISGATASSIVANTSGSYSVVVTNGTNCSATSSLTTVEVNSLTTPTFSQIASICSGESLSALPSTSNNSISGVWSLTSSNNTSVTYTFAPTSISSPTCATTTTMTINVNSLPTSTITTAGLTTFCKGGSIVLNANTDTGLNYQWLKNGIKITGANSVSYTVENTGVYSVIVTNSNNCSSTSSNQNVTVNSLPNVVAIATKTAICTGENITLTGTGASTYVWDNNVSNGISFVPTTTKTYTVTGTDVNGCKNTANVLVTVNTLPTVTANSNKSVVCSGDNVTLTGSGASTYTWDNNVSNGVSFSINATKTYTVTGSDANGCKNTASVSVNVNSLPTIAANATKTSICPGENVTLTGTGASTYVWDNNVSNGVSFIPSVTKTYTVTGTDANGCKNTANVLVTVNSLPTVIATATKTVVCTGDNVTLTGTGASTYAWDNNVSNGVSFVPTTTKTYSVTGTDVNGCKNTANVIITVNTLPTVTANSNKSVVCSGENVTLTGSGASTYTWDNNVSNGVSFTINTTKTYTVTGTDANGCKNKSSVSVTVNSLPTIVATATKTSICPGENVTLTASGTPNILWNNNITNAVSFMPSVTKTYTVTGTDENGCKNTANVLVTVNSLPTVIAIASKTAICIGDNVTLTGSGASTYAWDNNVSNGVSFVPSATKTYTVTGTDANGCVKTATVNVTVNALPTIVATASKTAVCTGESVTLTGSGASIYLWDNNVSNGVAFVPSSTKTYSVIGTDVNGCKNSASVSVSVNNLPAVSITANGNTTICKDDGLELSTKTQGSSYLWSNGEITSNIYPNQTGVYFLKLKDANGCEGISNSIKVTVNQLPMVTISLNGPTTYCSNKLTELVASNGVSYLWNDGTTSKTIKPYQSGSYFVKVTDMNGCSASSEPVYLTVNDCASIDQLSLQSVQLFPNPTTDLLSVEVSEDLMQLIYKIMDVSGKELVTGKLNHTLNTIDVEHLATGTYFFEIENGYRTKFIKQ